MQREPPKAHQIFLCNRERSRAEKRERSRTEKRVRSPAEIVQTIRLRRPGMNECLVFPLSLILIQE